MLKKFLGGLAFGAGFAVAFAVVWMAWIFAIPYFLPKILDTSPTANDRIFRAPIETKAVSPAPGAPEEKKGFSFFKHSGERMKIPENGGILSMSSMTTPSGAKRPSTYQLWLTGTKLWQIRTVEEKVEVEELPYPAKAGVEYLDDLMRKNVGMRVGHSTMTVSDYEMGNLKAGRPSSRDDTLNGKLSMTAEGVVFVQPNAY